MRILGMTAPELLVALAALCAPALILYWVVRLAVKHGIKDAFKERGVGDAE